MQQDVITYDIFRDDPAGRPVWVEAVEGLEHAMNRIEELAASDPADYYLYCAQAGKIIRHLKTRSIRTDERPGDAPQKKAG
jgi:hypothetical protein